jgi:hypothetical protein
MPGDPKECRLRSIHCAELAAKARTAELKTMFLGLSKQWEDLAAQLERVQAILDERDPDLKKQA